MGGGGLIEKKGLKKRWPANREVRLLHTELKKEWELESFIELSRESVAIY